MKKTESDKRLPGEDFQQYKESIRQRKERLDMYLKGRFVWRSDTQGTYVNRPKTQ